MSQERPLSERQQEVRAAMPILRYAELGIQLQYGPVEFSGSSHAMSPKNRGAFFACMTTMEPWYKPTAADRAARKPIDWSTAPPPKDLDPERGGIFVIAPTPREAINAASMMLAERSLTYPRPPAS